MMRLIERGLMYGNLVEVSMPVQVARYNAALEKLTGRRSTLDHFHIDLSGFSPEIGDEFGDDLYLNPNGCNRLFILLSLDQKRAPLLNAHFSTSGSILRHFYDKNAAQLFALTARDAVAGELVNSVYRLNKPADVLDIRTIEVEADTVSGHIANAGEMTRLIERFTTREDGWWDDALLAQMITLAERVGDIGRHPLALEQTTFRQGNFHTTHFGGLYVFPEVSEPGVIRVDATAATSDMPIRKVIDLADTKRITEFLQANRLIESVFDAKGLDAPALLRQRLDFILIDHLAASGEELSGLTRQGLRRVAQRNASDLPDSFHALADVLRWVQHGGRRPKLGPGNPAWFYTLRGRAHPDRDLVNMLLAHLTPLDVRQLFICHKAAFYRAYLGWSETKRSYVADFLANEYMIDKAGTRTGLFGSELSMEEPDIELGPWGPRRTI
ncbi:MAG TPA: DUF6638 family protein [Thermohalobaculum sp.]|nr:DUF6638 family protein [Thermohalobaculum sp.]